MSTTSSSEVTTASVVSVRTVKDEFLTHHNLSLGDYCTWPTEEHRSFFIKLNKLGWDKRPKNWEELPDLDAGAILSHEEYTELTEEYKRFQK